MRSIEILAARWRLELTSHLQRMYFDGRKRILSKLVDCSRKHSLGLPDGLVEKLDNIDQRLVNDAKLLCDTLSRIILQVRCRMCLRSGIESTLSRSSQLLSPSLSTWSSRSG